MELRPSRPSADEGAYPLVGEEIPEVALSVSKSPTGGQNLLNEDVVSAPNRSGATARTIVADPVVVGLGDKITANKNLAETTTNETAHTTPTTGAKWIQCRANRLMPRRPAHR